MVLFHLTAPTKHKTSDVQNDNKGVFIEFSTTFISVIYSIIIDKGIQQFQNLSKWLIWGIPGEKFCKKLGNCVWLG